MIDFRPAPLLLLAIEEPTALLPALPRAQLSFWALPPLTLEPAPKPAPAKRLEAFREWLGVDPKTLDPDDVFAKLLEFKEVTRRRRRKCPKGPQRELPTAAAKFTKPRSLGLLPTGTERKKWEKRLDLPQFPETRADCPKTRPCTFVRCRYHLKLDVLQDDAKRVALRNGKKTAVAPLKDIYPRYVGERYAYPGQPLDRMMATCALDLAHERPRTLEQIGGFLNVVFERVRQEEYEAIMEVAAKLSTEHHRVTYQETVLALRMLGREYQREKD